MLARHVKTKLFGHFDIKFERLIGRCSIDAIRPIALVERTGHIDHFVIQHRTQQAFLILALGNLTHAGIARHGIATEGDF